MNLIEGRLPGCLVNTLSELYVAGNSLGGPLPPFKPGNSLVTLYANQQHGTGFTGVFAWLPCGVRRPVQGKGERGGRAAAQTAFCPHSSPGTTG
jgi:hypothetical protein